jgi:RNA polymerase sigma factor (sigma-70 family)
MNSFVKQTIKLVEGCMANQRSAQEGLYKLFYTEMLRLCYRYLKTDDLAKDAVNQGFLKVFQHIDSFDVQKGGLDTWIKTIMVRTCIDIRRKEIKFSTELQDADKEEEIFIPPTILQKLYAEDLLKIIRKLPGASQLVFNLSVIDGYTHKEIGEQLNINESTSRWHLSEAKKQLRALLEPSGKSIDHQTEKGGKKR